MDTQINLLSDDALDTVSGGLGFNNALNTNHYAGQTTFPPVPGSSDGNPKSNPWGPGIAGAIWMGVVFAL